MSAICKISNKPIKKRKKWGQTSGVAVCESPRNLHYQSNVSNQKPILHAHTNVLHFLAFFRLKYHEERPDFIVNPCADRIQWGLAGPSSCDEALQGQWDIGTHSQKQRPSVQLAVNQCCSTLIIDYCSVVSDCGINAQRERERWCCNFTDKTSPSNHIIFHWGIYM